MMEKLFAVLPAERVYAATGIQFMQINTLFQLYSMVLNQSAQLRSARSLLMIPDYFHYILSGCQATEYTNATTSQCVNVRDQKWDEDLLQEVGIPTHIFRSIVPPGSRIGTLTPEVQRLTGLGEVAVIAPASHDTASAVAAIPAEGNEWAFISSGTWSLMGIETPQPIATPEAMKLDFTNEGGVAGTTCLLKNVSGLWLVQEIRSAFQNQYDYPSLVEMAKTADPWASLVDPVDPRFLAPAFMPTAIADFCRETAQPAPRDLGALVRCALESLAMQSRGVLDELRQLQDRPIRRIHIVGGGARNGFLCQLTADACGIPVIAGPAECTALGNLLVQAQSAGHIQSLAQGRSILKESFELIQYDPRASVQFDEAWERFRQLKSRQRRP